MDDGGVDLDAGGGRMQWPLRILFVTSDRFPPFRPAAKAIFAGELAARGHEIDWILQAESPAVATGALPFGSGTAYVAETDGGATRRRRVRKYWLGLKSDLSIFRLLRRRSYSLVQVKDKYVGALIAIAAAKYYGVPFFYWLAYPHAEASLYFAKGGMARYPLLYWIRGVIQRALLYKLIIPSARHVFVQSEQMLRDLAGEGVPLQKMTPVPSSVNLAELTASKAEDRTVRPAGERWILYLGVLGRDRQLGFLLRVLAKVLARVPGTRLLFVGGGEQPEDEASLRREARRLGIADSVEFTGWLPTARAWEYVRAADVCLSPYSPIPILRSTSPTKLVEYMAFGKPVVANDHPEQSLVIQQSKAGFVTPWDETSFADAVVYLLEHEREAREMGLAGRAFVEQHRTHTRLGELVESRYRSVLTEPVGRSRAAYGMPK